MTEEGADRKIDCCRINVYAHAEIRAGHGKLVSVGDKDALGRLAKCGIHASPHPLYIGYGNYALFYMIMARGGINKTQITNNKQKNRSMKVNLCCLQAGYRKGKSERSRPGGETLDAHFLATS